eukprot:4065457-Pyramimonas_sp.AAC.1
MAKTKGYLTTVNITPCLEGLGREASAAVLEEHHRAGTDFCALQWQVRDYGYGGVWYDAIPSAS